MLLARVAEKVYWAGRYIERVEDMARIVLVHGETHIDLPVGADVGWSPLLDICGVGVSPVQSAHRTVGDGALPPACIEQLGEAAVVEFVVRARDNPASILSSLSSARENLRVARSVVPREVWELVHGLWLGLSREASRITVREVRTRWLRRAIDECARANGILVGTMRRDEVMAFFTIGQQIERADITARLLRARTAGTAPAGATRYDDVHGMALLRSVAAYQPFRRAMPAGPSGGAVVRFLLQDEAFPRAVSSCLSELRETIKRLPANDDILEACTDACVMVGSASVDPDSVADVRRVVGEVQDALRTIDDRLGQRYFRSHPAVGVAPGRSTAAQSTREVPAVEEDDATSYRVVHTTTYEYQGLVERSYNEAHLRPRRTDRQQCVAHTLHIEPAATSRSEYVDAFGNAASIFVVTGGFQRLVATATSDVRVRPAPPPSVSPPWESVRWLLDADRRPTVRQAQQFRTPSRMIPALDEISAYALRSFVPGSPVVEATIDLASRIHRDFAYEPGFTTVATPLQEVLRHRHGVCQDFAHVAIGCLRAMGLAARYVSGYLETAPPEGQAKRLGVDASHAWFGVLVPGYGWLDVDPTNDQLVSDTYVTTAWGRDYGDVAPLRGSVEGGGDAHSLHVAVDVIRLAPAEATPSVRGHP